MKGCGDPEYAVNAKNRRSYRPAPPVSDLGDARDTHHQHGDVNRQQHDPTVVEQVEIIVMAGINRIDLRKSLRWKLEPIAGDRPLHNPGNALFPNHRSLGQGHVLLQYVDDEPGKLLLQLEHRQEQRRSDGGPQEIAPSEKP